MLEMLSFMAAPFAACLILVGVHGYLGLHVLLRQVIFVDLALAQIAALGAVVAMVQGHPPGTAASFAYSLGAAVFGALVFSLTRSRSHESKVPQEALIGITYVIASAAAILVADRAPEGAEHIKELLAGTILWVTWPTVIKDLIIYAAVGLFHYVFRKRFILISEDPERAYAQGMNVRLWDFLFYLSFGVIITLSVEIAGVLMVFSYLVAPAIIALGSSDRWGMRIVIAWAVGFLASALGLIASYQVDFPSGPAIVCSLGLFLLLYAVWRAAVRRPSPSVSPAAPPELSERPASRG
ncbi:MAG TPA: iron chelate uptake ABC transporter family permease subunit [Thermoanaerobaculia bacterium]|nr:iron chelate uptake ABC transporter family permease subunit [Thermoanaerobaculia bacterium]